MAPPVSPSGKSIWIDGLNASNWESDDVFHSLQESGLSAINATIAIWEDYEETLDNIAEWLHRLDLKRSGFTIVHSVDDIYAAKEQSIVGIILGWQNALSIGKDLKRLRLFRELGVRIVQLTYNQRNLLANGCFEEKDEGLSEFGRRAVREMNKQGILIDLSHVGDQSTLDVIECSDLPVAITHANARDFKDHRRNKTQQAIEALVRKGGVIGANAFPRFLPHGFDSTIDDLLDSIDYLVNMVGVEHVAIGSDFTQRQSRDFFDKLFSLHGTLPPDPYELPSTDDHLKGFRNPSDFPRVAEGLSRRGYSAEDVDKIMGGNWLKLFEQTWTSQS
ncbi:MAG TPA: membrane dipeptidase [Dehalococcoidia bacterium]|nr:membrane dipeptidase [Dehalococcoidia bacterium]